MTEERLSTIHLSERTLIKLAQLSFNQGTTTFEECMNNLLVRYAMTTVKKSK